MMGFSYTIIRLHLEDVMASPSEHSHSDCHFVLLNPQGVLRPRTLSTIQTTAVS